MLPSRTVPAYLICKPHANTQLYHSCSITSHPLVYYEEIKYVFLSWISQSHQWGTKSWDALGAFSWWCMCFSALCHQKFDFPLRKRKVWGAPPTVLCISEALWLSERLGSMWMLHAQKQNWRPSFRILFQFSIGQSSLGQGMTFHLQTHRVWSTFSKQIIYIF